MRRIAAAVVALVLLGAAGLSEAATLTPLDDDGLNLRAGPGLHHQVLAVLAAGETVPVLGYDGEWVRVRTPSGEEAWAAEWVSRVRYEPGEAGAVVNTDVLNVRQGAGLDHPVLGVITQGQRVSLLETAGEWWRVRTAEGLEGWVYAAYMKRAEEVAPPPPAPAGDEGIGADGADAGTGSAPGGGFSRQPAAIPAVPPPAPEGTVPALTVEPAAWAKPSEDAVALVRTPASVYLGPDTTAFEVKDTVRPGERLVLLDATQGWVRVETPRGRRGWLPGSAVEVRAGRLRYRVEKRRWTVRAAAPAGNAVRKGSDAEADVLERRAVRDADGLRLRPGPSLKTDVLAVLPQGEVLEVLTKQAIWLYVRTASGLKGWVHGGYTVPLPGGPDAGDTGAPQDGPALTAAVELVREGVLRLRVEGEELGPLSTEGTAVFIPMATGQQEPAVFPVGAAGAFALSVAPEGVRLSLERMPDVRVVEQGEGRLVVELRPVLTAITAEEREDRQVYRFHVAGHVKPRAAAAGPEVVIDLPGARAALLTVAEGVTVEERDGGLRIRVPSRRAFALKRSEEGLELHLYKPGLAGKVILLDPGHGGRDTGAWNPALRLAEKDVNLQVALRLRAKLAELGATVLMTRATDVSPSPPALREAMAHEDRNQVDMGYRTRMANELKVDLFLSIHHNSGDGSGTETYYTATTLNGGRSRMLAHLVQEEMARALGRFDRGVKEDLMFVTRNTAAPSALVEIAFVSDPVEVQLIGQPAFQDRAAEALVRALERFYAERTD